MDDAEDFHNHLCIKIIFADWEKGIFYVQWVDAERGLFMAAEKYGIGQVEEVKARQSGSIHEAIVITEDVRKSDTFERSLEIDASIFFRFRGGNPFPEEEHELRFTLSPAAGILAL